LISATDPVAVVALFEELKVSGRLSVVVEGESLFNDAAAMVLFAGILSAINSDTHGPVLLAQGVVSFVWVSLGGLGVGAAAAALYAALVRFAEDDPLIEIALSMVLAYTAFAVADHYLGVSGILAVVAGGLGGSPFALEAISRAPERRSPICGTTGATPNSSRTASFSLFLGIGGDTFLNRMRDASLMDMRYIVYAVGAVIVAPPRRRLWVRRRLQQMHGRRADRLAQSDHHLLGWRDARGLFPLVMVLSLPGKLRAAASSCST
jgi:NhaP-type Na+/H+ or K+/H+ antiporter